MKFKKEDALKKIKAMLDKTSLKQKMSDRSISDQLEKLIPKFATDETELDTFTDEVFPIFDTVNKNINHDVGTQVQEYKDANPVPAPPAEQPATPAQPEPPKKGDEGDDKYLDDKIAAAIAKALDPVVKTVETVQSSTTAAQAATLKANLLAGVTTIYGKEFTDKWGEKMCKGIDFTSPKAQELFQAEVDSYVADTDTAPLSGDTKPTPKTKDWKAERKRLEQAGVAQPLEAQKS